MGSIRQCYHTNMQYPNTLPLTLMIKIIQIRISHVLFIWPFSFNPLCSSITTAMRDKNGILWQKKHSKSRESLWILKCRKNITEFLLLPDSKVCSCHYCEEDFKLSSQYSSMANDKIKIIPTPTSFTLMY